MNINVAWPPAHVPELERLRAAGAGIDDRRSGRPRRPAADLLKGAPYLIDNAHTVFEEADPSDYDAASHWINQAFGSANP